MSVAGCGWKLKDLATDVPTLSRVACDRWMLPGFADCSSRAAMFGTVPNTSYCGRVIPTMPL